MAISFTTTVEDRWVAGGKKYSRVKLVSGESDTYATGGAALPAFGVLGLKRNLDYIIITDPASAVGYELKYDQVNKKILLYEGDNNNAADGPSVEVTAGTAFASKTIYCVAVGA